MCVRICAQGLQRLVLEGSLIMKKSNIRAIAPILIGFSAAGVCYGGFYLFKQQMRSRLAQEITIPEQWTLLTKTYVHRALDATTPQDQLKYYEKAVRSLVGDGDVDLTQKSADWLAGYSDLVRKIGLVQARAGSRDALQPLSAADTIKLGTAQLRYDSSVELFRLTGKKEHLVDAISIYSPCENLNNLQVPDELAPAAATAYLEVANLLLEGKDYKEALALYLRLHKSLPDDELCLRPTVAGFTGQILWKLKQQEDAKKWLEMSQRDSQRSTPACRQCNAVATKLLEKIK